MFATKGGQVDKSVDLIAQVSGMKSGKIIKQVSELLRPLSGRPAACT
jgi:hypothetical protein